MHALEARHAPVVSLWVWYQVGGRNEVPGTTGMSHFLEHMLFKGTPRHPKGDLDKLLARYGALWNAFTSEDVTCYFETVPAERYPVALELESDRMRNALITVEETEAERNVIVSEREGLENDPSFLLGEQLQAVAFSRHPYAQGVIGSKDEIKLMTRDGLYAHYRRHYAPNNAYFIVAGDAPASELLDRAAAAFGPLDAEAPIEPPKAPEPPQYGERRVIVRRAGGALPIIQIGHKAPRAADPRAAALSLLAVALGGATAGGGEAASGRSSRLYRALVDTGLATTVDASFQLMKDPYLFVTEAHLRPGVTHERVERVILDELEKIARSALTDDEFSRVRRQMLSASAFMTDTITWRAFRFGQLLATGAAASLGEWYDRLAAVTAEDVRAAAESVFQEKGRGGRPDRRSSIGGRTPCYRGGSVVRADRPARHRPSLRAGDAAWHHHSRREDVGGRAGWHRRGRPPGRRVARGDFQRAIARQRSRCLARAHGRRGRASRIRIDRGGARP
ncbi:MAG: insulinase family protein [Chloroflexi bacterium]|nr:MAG: insulinase family protein [Chloroflexota bacterium]